MKAIINGEVLLENKFYKDKVVLLDGTIIYDIIDKSIFDTNYKDIEIINASNNLIVPGFIDLQLNGCGGVLFNDDISIQSLKTMYNTNLKTGCTSFAPTLITTSAENIIKAIELMESIEDKKNIGVLGLHLEGPYISTEKKGIHNPKFIKSPEIKVIERIKDTGSENVRIITMAPENVDKDTIYELYRAGINVSVGHSNATFQEVKEKINYGIRLGTHLYNAMSSFTHREPGVVGAIFDSDLYCGVIADGYHSHFSAINSAKKIMGERLYLVTDAVAPVGTNMESFMFEGNKVYYKDGKCFGEDGTLGGSALTMDKAIKNLVEHCDVSLVEAIRMATLYPAKAINIDNKYGKLGKGYYADIVFLDKNNLDVMKVIANGEIKNI